MAFADPKTEQYLPEWTRSRFVVLDISKRWSPAIHRETLQQTKNKDDAKACVVTFESCVTARDVLLCCEMRNTVALILFLDQLERECLTVLGGLMRRRQKVPILVVCEDHHEELIPVMLEAGVDTVLSNVHNDVRVSQWCVRVLQSRGGL
jgi:hypothetical protein